MNNLEAEAQQATREATMRTAGDLYTIARTIKLDELSRLTLPEIERLSNEVARVVPAGNVPGLLLSGLTRLEGRRVDQTETRKHVSLLFRGLRQSFDKAFYLTMFAGPASVIYGYQLLLRLAGKDPDSAFSEGTWQFYLEFALREDSARHANETLGFQRYVERSRAKLNEADRLAAWLLAVSHFVQQLPQHLANEWRERVLLNTLEKAAEDYHARKAAAYRPLYHQWEKRRPFSRGLDGGTELFPAYRRRLFDAYWHPHYNALGGKARHQFDAQMTAHEADSLAAYQQQMSWLAYLEPDSTSETRLHYPLHEANLGVIWQGRYYLLNLLDAGDLTNARRCAAHILADRPEQSPAALDDLLISIPRAGQPDVRRRLNRETLIEVEHLRRAPVLLNWDVQDARQPLAAIRRSKRGIGDHAMTIFRTTQSMVFDLSHIFFDGAWGASVAEIMTNESCTWAHTLAQQSSIRRSGKAPYSPTLQAPAKAVKPAAKSVVSPEASAENATIQIKPILTLRQSLLQRNEMAHITVNDLFILYRGLHAALYRPSPHLQKALDSLASDQRAQRRKAYQAVQDSMARTQNKNPAILIPIDASRHAPYERVFPTTFRNPFTDFLTVHQRAVDALRDYQQDSNKKTFKAFEETRVMYLRLIGGFGEVLQRYKEIALRGQSMSTVSIKFLAHLPSVVQQLLNSIPNRFDLLNEVIKGEEVFSNVGRVATGSSLRRFITATDDNQQKMFAWGVLTDDDDVVRFSLRDFRPHVKVLYEAGLESLAHMIAQDYLDAYADGLNSYITDLRNITLASETRTKRGIFG